MISPDDAEDLVCMWLFKKYGYVTIPSSNKISTQKYECVLLDTKAKERKHVYVQVKKGAVDLNAEDYKDLAGDVYLLTTEGTVANAENYSNVHVVSSKEIFDFATDPVNATIIPENIEFWIRFLGATENQNNKNNGIKGIMFDTNLSYSDTNEKEMLEKNRICAYGAAQRYINSFKKDDYVFYYSKGKGIIAAGKILSSESIRLENADGLYRDVEMIVPPLYANGEIKKCLSAAEIKQLLDRGFYFASTIKTPYLSEQQSLTLINALKG
ncbi:MAG: hypothetical protein IKW30_00550 [Lachnospiraceae bacterium]|nr:hypothetical protein [Lachnospiraceae bacterium]